VKGNTKLEQLQDIKLYTDQSIAGGEEEPFSQRNENYVPGDVRESRINLSSRHYNLSVFKKTVVMEKIPLRDVLGLPGMELIFFIAAYMVLCFKFVTKTVLITYQNFSYLLCLHKFKAFSVSHSVPQQVGKRLGGETAGTADLN